MRDKNAWALTTLLGAISFGAAGSTGFRRPSPRRSEPGTLLAGWPRPARLAARAMIEKYGLPQRTSENRLEWENMGPWKRIVVHRDSVFPLEQAVAYAVPSDKLAALEEFHRGVTVDAGTATLAVRGDGEAYNLLTLNLADEIATGKKSPAQAARFFDKTSRLLEAGKSSRYTDRLLFL